MDKKQLGALFLIILMVASVIGYTVFYSTPPVPEQEIPPLQENPAAIKYMASNVKSRVVELLPTIRFAASATNPNIGEIDKKIFSYPGIRNITSSFSQPQQQELGIGLVYVADISFSRDVNRQGLLSFLNDVNFFSGNEIMSYALVSIPKKITLIPENPDLNLSREQEFQRTVVEAFVQSNTDANQEIEIDLSVTLSGNEISEMIAYQSLVKSPQFEQKQAGLKAQISELFPELFVQATIDSAEVADINAFKQQFIENRDVNAVDVSIPEDIGQEAVSKPVQIAIKISLKTTSAGNSGAHAESLLKGKTAQLSITQPAIISLAEVTDTDSNASYAVPEGKFTAFIKPGHAVGEEVSLQLSYFVSGTQILSISGEEK